MDQKLTFFLSLSILFFKVTQANLSVNEKIELVKSVTKQLDCKSVVLLCNNCHSIGGLQQEIHFQKQLSNDLKAYTETWNLKTLGFNFLAKYFTSKTLIVMEFDSMVIEKLNLVSNNNSLAFYSWLILSTPTDVRSHFKNTSIPFNCHFIASQLKQNDSVILLELYKISKDSDLIVMEFGSWTLQNGLRSLKGNVLNRRKDLKKHQFKFAVHTFENPCKGLYSDNGRQTVQCAYYEVWNELEQILNYTTEYMVIEDCYRNSTTGLSTPMLEMIRNGEVDSGEDGYVWSSSRLIHNQFLWPLFQSKVILVTKIPSRRFSVSSYLRPFNTYMWCVLIAWLILSGLILNLTKYFVSFYIHKKFLPFNENIEYFFLPFRAICNQGSSILPDKMTIRIAYLMVYLIPLLLIPSYSGSLISSLSVPSENIPFNDLNEFEKDGTYQLNAINNTFFQFFLLTDEKMESLRKKKLISTTKTLSYEQSFREICSTSVTFIFEWPLLTNHSINCNVFKFDLALKKVFSSMAVQKNFPYLELFNQQMQKLIISGLNTKILERSSLTLFRHEVNPFPQHFFQTKPFDIEDVLPLFAILALGLLLSFFILFLEKHFK